MGREATALWPLTKSSSHLRSPGSLLSAPFLPFWKTLSRCLLFMSAQSSWFHLAPFLDLCNYTDTPVKVLWIILLKTLVNRDIIRVTDPPGSGQSWVIFDLNSSQILFCFPPVSITPFFLAHTLPLYFCPWPTFSKEFLLVMKEISPQMQPWLCDSHHRSGSLAELHWGRLYWGSRGGNWARSPSLPSCCIYSPTPHLHPALGTLEPHLFFPISSGKNWVFHNTNLFFITLLLSTDNTGRHCPSGTSASQSFLSEYI